MRATYNSSGYRARPSRRDRAAASALSLAIIAAIVVALLWVTAAQFVDMDDQGPLTTFDVASGERPQPAAERDVAKPQPKRRPPPPQTRAPPPPIPLPTVPSMLTMTRDEFAASDIGAMRAPAAEPGQGTAVADAGGSTYGPSEAPGGRTLHAADWYREPTRAEMVTYMPAKQQVGWGMVACQTAERFRVENCREIGESPGSGISRGLRRASWQFLVRPPQVNGKPQIGAWVRIRFDLVEGIVK